MKIQKNEGTVDRIIRVVVGVLALSLGYWGLSGLFQTIAYVVGVVALVTGIVGYCGLYALCGASTCPMKK